MDNSTTMYLLKIGLLVLAIACLSLAEDSTPPKSKRQIYREQVLPSRGGKIPESAFRSDRLALNRLNKEGIAIPDGVLLEHRHVHSHPHINKHDPEDEDSLVHIVQRPEDRYVAEPGKLHNKRPLTVASTYLIRKPIGNEGTFLRTPLEQVPYYETLNHQHGNQIYQTYPETYYQTFTPQPYLPPQKYLPSKLTAPTQNYIPVDITPPQKYIQIQAPPEKFFPEVPAQKYLPAPTVVHHPHPQGYKAPVSYQQVHQSVAYHPIVVPLEIPNKEALKTNYYYSKNQESHQNQEDAHNVISWPYLLGQYTKLSDKINALDQETYGQSNPRSLFFNPQVLGTIDSNSNYYSTRDRYARKSKEISFTEFGQEPVKSRLKDGRKLIKLKCSNRLENTVEDGSSQCFIRY